MTNPAVTSALIEQVDYYFSEANLAKDTYLKQQIADDHEGYVSLKTLLTFKRVAAMTTDENVLHAALKGSTKLVLHPRWMAVRRKDPMPGSKAAQILDQVCYYFSDGNLAQDVFLRKKIGEDPQGFVPFAVLFSFKRLAALTTDAGVLVNALRDCEDLDVDILRQAVRRKVPFVMKAQQVMQQNDDMPRQTPPPTAGGGGGNTATTTTINGQIDDGRWWQRRTLTVMQFNVLCRCYEPSHIPLAKFKNRFPIIQKQIWKYNPDVLSLNECNPISQYRAAFGDQYDILFCSKTESRLDGKYNGSTMLTRLRGHGEGTQKVDPKRLSTQDAAGDGTALCIKKSSAQVLGGWHLCFVDNSNLDLMVKKSAVAAAKSNGTAATAGGGGGGGPNPAGTLLTREDVTKCIKTKQLPHAARQFAVMAHIRQKNNIGAECLVLTMHMKCNNHEDHQDEMRLRHLVQLMPQVKEIQAEIQRASGGGPLPVIFVGDFNATPNSPTMDYLLQDTDGQRCKESDTAELSVPPQTMFGFRSALADAGVGTDQTTPGGEGGGRGELDMTIMDSSYTQGKKPWHSTLDYILYDDTSSYGKMPHPKLHVVSAVTAIQGWKERTGQTGDAKEVNDALPYTGSDHIPVVAEFLLLH